MDEKKAIKLIKDDEFNMFLEHDYARKLEEEILESEIGKRAKLLENLGFGISVSDIVEQYISQEGYTMNNEGNLLVEETALEEIYNIEEKKISKKFKIDISKITDISILQRIASDQHYRRDVEKYGVEGAFALNNVTQEKRGEIKKVHTYKDVLKAIDAFLGNELKPEDASYISNILFTNLPDNLFKDSIIGAGNENLSQDDIDQIVNNHNKKMINSNLDNKISTHGMRQLYGLRDLINQKEENNEIDINSEMQEIIGELEGILPDFQYKDFIVDEYGKINVDKAVTFLNNWEKTRNETKLTEDLSGAANCDFTKVGMHNIAKFMILFEKANRGDSAINKTMALSIAKKIRDISGIDLLKDNEIDREKISSMYAERNDGLDINDAIDQIEWNADTAEGKLNRIDVAIDYDLGIRNDSREQINLSKDLATEILENQKKDKQRVIENLLLQERCSPEQVVALFYEFRYEELAKSKKKFEQFGPKQLKDSMEHGIARLLEDYMKNNPEMFKEYLTEMGNLSGLKIDELIQKNEFSNLQRVGIANAHKLIEEKVSEVEKTKSIDIEKSKELLILIEGIRGKAKEEVSDKERKIIFEKAERLGRNNSLSKVIMRELIWIDKEQFKEMYSRLKENANKEQGVSWFKKTISEMKKGMYDLPKFMMRSEPKKPEDRILVNKINTMAKKVKEQKEKIAQNLELGKVKDYESAETSSNLPAVKKITILDKIKGLFSKDRDTNKESNAVVNSNQDTNDKAANNQTSGDGKESLTTTEKSDKTVTAKTGGLDYIKVDVIPTVNQTSTKLEQNNQTEISKVEPEETEIGE